MLWKMLSTFVLLPAFTMSQMCSSVLNLGDMVSSGRRLPGRVFLTFKTAGIMTCVRSCLVRSRCKSINYDSETRYCELNRRVVDVSFLDLKEDQNFMFSLIHEWPLEIAGSCRGHSCPLRSMCEPVNDTSHICVPICETELVIENGKLTGDDVNSGPIGTLLDHTCDVGYVANGVVECRSDGTWNTDVCVSATSCRVIKQHLPDSEDGEYRLHLTHFENYLTLIYCHNMSTDSPQEFLTLENLNYGFYPMVANLHCRGERPLEGDHAGEGGKVWYSKVKVNVTTMQVDQRDRTFAKLSNHPRELDYGVAFDCYDEHVGNDPGCGVLGQFIIDLRGTGWRVADDQQWHVHGFKAMMLSLDRRHNNTHIDMRCGGNCGGCRPKRRLHFVPFPEDNQS